MNYILFKLKKILFSFAFPISLLLHCSISFFIPRDKKKYIWRWDRIIYYIREEYDNDNFTVICYSFFPAFVYGSIIYILKCYIFKAWYWDPITFFSIILAIGALLVSIIIALILKKKTIESGVQFMDQLYIHINYLKHIPLENRQPHILYIISPNINLGKGIDYKLINIINNRNITKKIKFKFICKSISTEYLKKYPDGPTETAKKHTFFQNTKKCAFFFNAKSNNSEMLKYLYDRYYDNSKKRIYDSQIKNLDELIKELNNVLSNKDFEFIQIYDDFVKCIISDKNLKSIQIYNEILRNKNVCGYLSTKECVLGTYINVKEKKGEIIFRGETFISSEFIEYVRKKCINKIIGI